MKGLWKKCLGTPVAGEMTTLSLHIHIYKYIYYVAIEVVVIFPRLKSLHFVYKFQPIMFDQRGN